MLNLMKLENRIVLDGAAVGEALDHAADHEAAVGGSDSVPDCGSEADQAGQEVAQAAALLNDGPASGNDGLDIILVSDSLPDYQAFAEAALPESQVIIYSADTETSDEILGRIISMAQDSGKSVDSVTIVSHGGSGYFNLGTDSVTAENLIENADAWADLDAAMSKEGHIYLLGCNVADGSGQTLLDGLARLTGASVYASDDVTGADGDWVLEAASENADDDPAPPLNTDILSSAYGHDLAKPDNVAIHPTISSAEDKPGSYNIFIYGEDEDENSRDADSIELSDDQDDDIFVDGHLFLNYNGWITDQPRVIDGELVEEYHRWTVEYDPVSTAYSGDGEYGTATINLDVEDGGSYSTEVKILPVNDPPDFEFNPDGAKSQEGAVVEEIDLNDREDLWELTGFDPEDPDADPNIILVTVDEDAGGDGIVDVRDFVNNIIAGPDNEWIADGEANPANPLDLDENVWNQRVQFEIENVSDSGLFGTLPTISPDTFTPTADAQGDLHFELKENANGTVLVNVVLRDDGGTELDGMDATPVRQFIIQVNPVNDRPDAPVQEDIHIYEDNGDPDNDYVPTPEAQVEGFTVDEMIQSVNDPDDPEGEAPVAIAITGIDDASGEWQYRLDEDSEWTTLQPSNFEGDNALLLTADNQLRFIPDENFNDEQDGAVRPSFTCYGWDQSNEMETGFQVIDPENDDAFSRESTEVELEVRAVNDAPVLSINDTPMPDADAPQGSQITYTTRQGEVTIEGLSAGDIDIALSEGDGRVEVTLSTEEGLGGVITLNLSEQVGDMLVFSEGDGTDDYEMTFSGQLSDVNAALASITYSNASSPFVQDQITVQISDEGNYGVPGERTDTGIIVIMENQGPSVGNRDDIFIEDCAPVRVAGTITEPEGEAVRSVVISFADGTFRPGDVLHYDDSVSANVDANYNPATGQLVLSAVNGATVNDFQAVLNTVTYENTSEDPNTVQRRFEIVATDADGNEGDTAVSVISVVPVNDEPIAALPSAVSTLTDTPVEISNIAVSDADVGDSEVLIEIRADYGTIALSQADVGRIEAAGGTVTGNGGSTLTITASLSVAAPGGILSALTYTPTSGYSGGDTLSIRINDQGYTGVDRDLHVPGCQLSGVIALDADGQVPAFPNEGTPEDPSAQEFNGTIPISVLSGTVAFVENCDTADGVLIIDPATHPGDILPIEDSMQLGSLTIVISNATPNDYLTADTAGTGITASAYSYDAASGQGVLQLTGTDSAANYENVLETVRYGNTSEDPDDTTREVHYEVRDAQNSVVIGTGGNMPILTRVSVIPVNDAPINSFPSELATSQNVPVILEGISVGDPDIEQSGGEIQATVTVRFGNLDVLATDTGATISRPNGSTSAIVIRGTLSQVNAALATLQYTPLENFKGNDTLSIETTDMAYSGIGNIDGVSSDNPSFCDAVGNLIVNEGVEELERIRDEEAEPGEGNPYSPHALTDRDVINLTVAVPGPPPVEPPPQPPVPPGPPIVVPEGRDLAGIELGAVRLPGPVGLTEGAGNRLWEDPGFGGRGRFDFCSLEEALELGCRFAHTNDLQAKFSAVSWEDLTDLGWTEPYLDEEFDLYSRLFLREEGDPGFNQMPGALNTDLGGQSPEKPQIFDHSAGMERLNDIGPKEMKTAFFENKDKTLDRTGRGKTPTPID